MNGLTLIMLCHVTGQGTFCLHADGFTLNAQILISDLGDTPLIYSALTCHCPHILLASDKSFLISNSSETCLSTQFTITTAALLLVVPLRADLKSGHYK
mgnify:CR=1 FL=1